MHHLAALSDVAQYVFFSGMRMRVAVLRSTMILGGFMARIPPIHLPSTEEEATVESSSVGL